MEQGASRPKYIICIKEDSEFFNTVSPNKVLYKEVAPRVGFKEIDMIKIRASKGSRPLMYGIGTDFHLEELVDNFGNLDNGLVNNLPM